MHVVCLAPALVLFGCLLLGLGSRDFAAPGQCLLFSFSSVLVSLVLFFITLWWRLQFSRCCCCYEFFRDVFLAFLAFLVHISGECVVSFRLTSGRHFIGGFVALVVFVSAGLFLRGFLHVMMLRLRPFLHTSFRIAHAHVLVSDSYLSVPLAFSPDSLGCLGLPLT